MQVLRSKAGLLIQQIEDKVAGGRLIFGCDHPLYTWALIHAGWLQNRFVVSGGQAAFERASDRQVGRLQRLVKTSPGILLLTRVAPAGVMDFGLEKFILVTCMLLALQMVLSFHAAPGTMLLLSTLDALLNLRINPESLDWQLLEAS